MSAPTQSATPAQSTAPVEPGRAGLPDDAPTACHGCHAPLRVGGNYQRGEWTGCVELVCLNCNCGRWPVDFLNARAYYHSITCTCSWCRFVDYLVTGPYGWTAVDFVNRTENGRP